MKPVAALLVVALILAGCGTAPGPSATGSPTAEPASTGPASTSSGSAPASPELPGGGSSASAQPAPGGDATAGLAGALEAAGADVRPTGPFTTEPIGGTGVGLCVDGQQINVYVFPTAEERATVAGRIDPDDPSNVGTAMISWAGNPRFWQADRLIVLYLGDDPAVESGLSSVLGQPFARGEGRGPGPALSSC